MRDLLYDTRFFIEYFYSKDENIRRKCIGLTRNAAKNYVSTITIHELYRITLAKDGRDVAKLRHSTIEATFRVKDVDTQIAIRAAEISSKHPMPMADSMIAATSSILNAECVTDDPHFSRITEIKVRWL